MNNLFSVFDPTITWFGISVTLNWVSAARATLIFVSRFWKVLSKIPKIYYRVIKALEQEITINLGRLPTPGLTHLIVSLFMFIRLNNYLGLTPYTFTRTRHLSFTVSLALILWLRLIIIRITKSLGHILVHFVPLGTPYLLIPLIVIIELIRNVIRPLTLSVRLAANIVAGHLLLTLISRSVIRLHARIIGLGLVGLGLLIILENAVALIQAYVFRILPSLYLAESNKALLHYLNNDFTIYYTIFFIIKIKFLLPLA